ncbi:bifunctional folylpolyglutamate synthase/dihydrofolate synthase [Bacillus sp. SJS]|uniref:bifunctional folylpolyglutamate synthase/dihydrofolate synthase n=1 Tax=Bacillus sp. SJS TaxID=1423321 RepID=UPI0004DD0466|nr:folylpolyglutamate synthase/dihydrofolate synthase family protein [Bacillus sp. SJS]KZZ86120.1 bifunctional folylpolyglutamate synthase/dihydrofolate synthase [Bacillus sp. SJS]
MLNTYEEALDWIHSRLRFGIKPGLGRMVEMMEKLGNPHTKIPVIHVAGTNGKGSTVSYMRSMLNEAGYKAGTFTSPYLETFNERISMDGYPISDDDLLRLANAIKPAAERVEAETNEAPTEFEIITAMAFLYFGEFNRPDYVLLETGLGGRLDSTNIAEPILSIITNTGYDHMHILGDTIEEIASEKAGIIKRKTPVVTGVQKSKGLEQIRKKAADENAEVYVLGDDFQTSEVQSHTEGETFSFTSPFGSWEDLQITMFGVHQTMNASLALAALSLLREKGLIQLSDEQIRKGLYTAKWSGRYEVISRDPLIVIDGAHNLEGVESLTKTLKGHESDKTIHMLFTALEDKEYDRMLYELEKTADYLYLTEFEFPRAASSTSIYNACRTKNKKIIADWKSFLNAFPKKLKSDEMLIICGSLYFISQVRQYLLAAEKKILGE